MNVLGVDGIEGESPPRNFTSDDLHKNCKFHNITEGQTSSGGQWSRQVFYSCPGKRGTRGGKGGDGGCSGIGGNSGKFSVVGLYEIHRVVFLNSSGDF